MNETAICTRFIVASKNYSTKRISDTVCKIFKISFNTVENFHNKSPFYSGRKRFWVGQSSFPIVTKLKKKKVNVRKNVKSI